MNMRCSVPNLRAHSGILLLVVGACAQGMTPALADDLNAGVAPIGMMSLDTMRGGFLMSDNVKFSLMFSSRTLVDGIVKAQSVLTIKDLGVNGNVVAVQSGSLGTLVQNGSGNTVSNSAPLDSQYITVIQNSVDQTFIQHSRNLSLQVQGIGGLQTLATSSSITHQIIESLH